MTTVPLAWIAQQARLLALAVLLPFARILTLVARAAHRATRRPVQSRSTIFVGGQQGNDYPSRPTGSLVPSGTVMTARPGPWDLQPWPSAAQPATLECWRHVTVTPRHETERVAELVPATS
jgi:hypothetical protein